MTKMFLGAAALALGMAAIPAGAMPLSPLENGSAVTLVANGCGPGWVRGPGGACHRMGYVAPVVVAPRVVAPVVVVPAHRCWWRAGVRVCG